MKIIYNPNQTFKNKFTKTVMDHYMNKCIMLRKWRRYEIATVIQPVYFRNMKKYGVVHIKQIWQNPALKGMSIRKNRFIVES